MQMRDHDGNFTITISTVGHLVDYMDELENLVVNPECDEFTVEQIQASQREYSAVRGILLELNQDDYHTQLNEALIKTIVKNNNWSDLIKFTEE